VRDIVVDAGETLNINTTRTLNLAGAGSAINGVVNSSGTINAAGLTVSGASAQLNMNCGGINTLALTLSNGGRVSMSPGADKVIRTGSLSVSTASGAKVDISDNKLIVVNGNVG